MHPMLADSIDGGILAILVFLGGLVTAVLALCALVPAWQCNRAQTFILAAPAFVFALLVTGYVAYGYITQGSDDPDARLGLRDFIGLWIIMAGPAFVTTLLAISLLFVRRARRQRL